MTGTARQRWLGAAAVIALATAGLAGAAQAQTAHGSATWSPAPGSGDWNIGGNWVPATVPNGPADTATFGVSTTTAVSTSQNTTVSGITFAATAVATPYTITAAPGTTLTIGGAGVANNSGVTQNIVVGSGTTNAGVLYFEGAASIAGAVVSIVNNAGNYDGRSVTSPSGAVDFVFGGTTIFEGTSSAGSAAITNQGAATIPGSAPPGNASTFGEGATIFQGHATAGNATIVNTAAAPHGFDGGRTDFFDDARAGSATISAAASFSGDGSNYAPGGQINFFDRASADSATITVNGDGANDEATYSDTAANARIGFFGTATAATSSLNIRGGAVSFGDSATAGAALINVVSGGAYFQAQSSGGTARVVLGPSAVLDVSEVEAQTTVGNTLVYTARPIGLGSFEGSGTVRLGRNELLAGSNNLSATFAGVINEQDTSDPVSSGPELAVALDKVGTGTLTLSGASTFARATAVDAGTLSVTGSLASAVTVNGGGTLTNSGTIGGLALAAGGTLASTGTPTTLTDTGAASFASGSILNLDITAAGASDKIAASGAVTLGGATLNILAAPGSYTGTSYTLLTAGGGLTGTFTLGSVTGGTFTGQPTLTYTANSVLLNFAALATPTHGSATWMAAPANGNWNSAANWVGNVVPNGSADTATFDRTSIPGVTLSQNTEVNGIVFNPGAAANPYTITAAPGTTLTISGAGVVNNSGVAQTLAASGVGSAGLFSGRIAFTGNASAGTSSQTSLVSQAGSAGGGRITFANTSTAGSATLIANGGTGDATASGRLQFFDNSTAGTARIFINAGSSRTSNGLIQGGSAQFFGTSSAGGSTITVAGDGLNDINNNANEGFLVFAEQSSATNATLIGTGGRIQFEDSATAGNATIQLAGGGIDFYDTASGGTAKIVLAGTATLDISATTTAVPGAVSIGSLEGTGFVRLGQSALTVGANNGSTVFAGSITEGGRQYDLQAGIFAPTAARGNALVKAGSGSLTLSGASTYTGPTTVAAGTLSVTGSLVSPVTVNSGATLTVSGKVGGVTLASGAILATLGTPQTMTVTGAASFAAGSTVKLVVTPTAGNDQIAVGGAAQLGGAALQVAASPGAYGTQRYTLLTAAGGVNGTFAFAGLATVSPLVSSSLIYSPTSVVLAFQRTQIAGGTVNQRAVAGALNADALTAPFLLALTTGGLPTNAQLDQASGELHATLRSALFADGSLVREAVVDRMLGAGADDDARPGLALWADVRGARVTLDGDGNAARAHDSGQVTVIGADYAFGEGGIGTWRLGAAYAHHWGRTTIADRASNAKWDGDSVAIYAGGVAGPVALRGGASETWYRVHSIRAPGLPGGGTATDGGQYGARLGQLFGEAALGGGIGGARGEAFGRWTGERLTTDAFAENGGATALAGARHRNSLGWSLAGLRGAVPVAGAISFGLSAGWAHLFGQAAPSATLADSTGTGFTVLGAPLARDAARVAAALSARVGTRLMLRFGYDGDYAGGNTQHQLNAAAAVRF